MGGIITYFPLCLSKIARQPCYYYFSGYKKISVFYYKTLHIVQGLIFRRYRGLSSNGTILYAKGVKHTQKLLQPSVFLYCQSQKVHFLRHPVMVSVESRGGITLRPSLLNLDVAKIAQHAKNVLLYFKLLLCLAFKDLGG